MIYFNHKSIVHSISNYCNIIHRSRFVCSAGTKALLVINFTLLYKVVVYIPSTLLYCLSSFNYATSGLVSNISYIFIFYSKASSIYFIKRRPKVKGTRINPIDHPHGGRTIGRPLVSP